MFCFEVLLHMSTNKQKQKSWYYTQSGSGTCLGLYSLLLLYILYFLCSLYSLYPGEKDKSCSDTLIWESDLEHFNQSPLLKHNRALLHYFLPLNNNLKSYTRH